MRSLVEFILEDLDIDNIFWYLDKWFERNEDDQKWFINLLMTYEANKTNDVIKNELDHFKDDNRLNEFINFITNDINGTSQKDNINVMKRILDICISNQSKRNRYKNLGK